MYIQFEYFQGLISETFFPFPFPLDQLFSSDPSQLFLFRPLLSDDGRTYSDHCEITKIDNSVNIYENESSFVT